MSELLASSFLNQHFSTMCCVVLDYYPFLNSLTLMTMVLLVIYDFLFCLLCDLGKHSLWFI